MTYFINVFYFAKETHCPLFKHVKCILTVMHLTEEPEELTLSSSGMCVIAKEEFFFYLYFELYSVQPILSN